MLTAASVANAQDWQTVRPADTVFFVAGPHSGMPQPYWVQPHTHVAPMPSMVRALYVIATNNFSNGNTQYVFPKAVRDTNKGGGYNYSKCMDTASPSWLGRFVVHSSTGTEYYINSKGDTITLFTLAQPGYQWTIAHSSSGVLIKASLSNAGIITFDGITDSFKTVTLQAYDSNGAPVAHWCNSLLLQWSKQHGWLKALDFYCFPNNISNYDHGGEVTDLTQHFRLPAKVNVSTLNYDALTQYTAGNEWIVQRWYGNNGTLKSYKTTHDSVLSTALLTGNRIAAQLKSVYYSDDGISTLVSTNTHWDTLNIVTTIQQFKTAYFAEPKHITSRFFIDTTSVCGNYLFSIENLVTCGGFGCVNGCCKLNCYEGVYHKCSRYIMPMGLGYDFEYYDDLDRYNYVKELLVSYMRIGGCVSGIKYTPLSTTPELHQLQVRIAPIPANTHLSVNLELSAGNCDLVLRNAIGKVIFTQSGISRSAEIQTGAFPNGLYLLEISGKEAKAFRKVIIMH